MLWSRTPLAQRGPDRAAHHCAVHLTHRATTGASGRSPSRVRIDSLVLSREGASLFKYSLRHRSMPAYMKQTMRSFLERHNGTCDWAP